MRRSLSAGLLGILMAVGLLAAEDGLRPVSLVHRYGIEVDLERYPQGNPQETIRSVIKATKAGQIDYMLAHLISPKQVDAKLHGDARTMRALAGKATPKKSAVMITGLKRQLADGTWTIHRNLAWSCAPGLPELSLEKIGDHWYMHNTAVPRPKAKKG